MLLTISILCQKPKKCLQALAAPMPHETVRLTPHLFMLVPGAIEVKRLLQRNFSS